MPIAQVSGFRGTVRIPGAVAAGDIRANAAVAVTNDGTDILISECSAFVNAAQFVGFAVSAVSAGDPLQIFSMRGISITPILEGDVPLILNEPVFLSDTLGEVRSAPVFASGKTFLQVGVAVSTTQLSLNTDAKVTAG